ncbi:MAG: CARDB domain-containing protein, partial [Thermodesulfovibrionales bacterium]
IYAVVDPAAAIDTENRNNNSDSMVIVQPDLSITGTHWEKISDSLIAFTARITNIGAIPTGPTTVTFRNGTATGKVLLKKNIASLVPFESRDLSYTWDVSASPAASYAVVVTADEGNTVAESDETNNSATIAVDGFSPANLKATALSSNRIVLSWTDRASNEEGFRVERKTGVCSSANAWAEIKTVAANKESFTDTTPAAATRYSYRVKAYNGQVSSAYSNCASAITAKNGTPNAPTGLRATAASSSAVTLAWTDASSEETRFEVWRKAGTGTWAKLSSTAANTKTYKDTTASGNAATTDYQYYLKACNAAGCSPASNIATVPFKPADLKAGASAGEINLTWADNSSNEKGFQVYRKAGACSSANAWSLLTTTVANASAYSDTTVVSGSGYSYRVRAFSQSEAQPFAVGYSLYSNCAEAAAP